MPVPRTWATNPTDSPNFDRAIFQTLPRPARRTFRASNLSPPDFAPRNTYRTPAITPTKLSTASNSPDTPPRPTPRLAASLYTWAKASRLLAGTASTRASPAMKSNSRIDCTWTIRRVKSNAEGRRSSLYFQSIHHKRKEKLFCCQHEKQHSHERREDDGRVYINTHVMRILLFLLDLFFSRSRRCKDEEMNRFSKRGDPIENRRTPDASKRSIQRRRRRRRTSSSRRIREPSFTERQKRKHARSARKRGSLDFKSTRAYARERERERMNQTRIVKKTTTTTTTRAPARASFCATNNPSNGLFLCHWRTLARFSIASSAASSNRKRQYACGLIDCSMR